MRKDMMMGKTLSWKKILGLIALILAPFFLAQCGDAGMSASSEVGPAGPTEPSGYYFEVTLSPNVIQSGNSVSIRVRVWDSNGNTAAGVPVILVGDASDPKKSFLTSGDKGWVVWVSKVKHAPGSVVFYTVIVENKSLAIPLQIVSGTGTKK